MHIMKNIKKLFTIICMSAAAGFIMTSCQKIDTGKLAGNWKVKVMTSTYEYLNKKTVTNFDGTKKNVEYFVNDTMINGELTNYYKFSSYAGEIIIDFGKKGSYYYKESFQDDTTFVATTIETNGLWYFTNKNGEAGYNADELLAIQITKLVNTSTLIPSNTTLYQGENTTDIYLITKLTSKAVNLKLEKVETLNFVVYHTLVNIELTPR